MSKIHNIAVPGFMVTFLWIFKIGAIIDKDEPGKCANIIIAISKIEVAFSVGLRSSEPTGEGYGQA